MKLLFVHGRAQEGRTSEEIKHEWLEALNVGMKKDKQEIIDLECVEVPFYGDILKELSQTSALLPASDLGVRSDDNYSDFLKDLAREVAEQHASLLPQDLKTKQSNNKSFSQRSSDFQTRGRRADLETRGPQNWWWVIEVVRALDTKFPMLSLQTISSILHDVYVYVANSEVRKQIDHLVSERLSEKPTIVIGHSLGSVVAYNVLCSYPHSVPLFVTVGCPLGINAIRSRLPQPLRYPINVGDWCNAYDRQDIVALNPLDSKNFPVERSIRNFGYIDNKSENHHNIKYYLNDKTVAHQISSAMKLAGETSP